MPAAIRPVHPSGTGAVYTPCGPAVGVRLIVHAHAAAARVHQDQQRVRRPGVAQAGDLGDAVGSLQKGAAGAVGHQKRPVDLHLLPPRRQAVQGEAQTGGQAQFLDGRHGGAHGRGDVRAQLPVFHAVDHRHLLTLPVARQGDVQSLAVRGHEAAPQAGFSVPRQAPQALGGTQVSVENAGFVLLAADQEHPILCHRQEPGRGVAALVLQGEQWPAAGGAHLQAAVRRGRDQPREVARPGRDALHGHSPAAAVRRRGQGDRSGRHRSLGWSGWRRRSLNSRGRRPCRGRCRSGRRLCAARRQ